MSTTHYRICPLCEATCGLAIEVEDGTVQRIRGDAEDAFSGGYLCPKGPALKALHEDPDRLRAPLVRDGDRLRHASWDEAFKRVDAGFRRVLAAHGPQALGVYLGNPNVHELSSQLYLPFLLRALGTPNLFSASSADQLPKQLAVGLMFGTPMSVPIPDIDHTDFLLIVGANPMASNGSLFTAPDLPGRLKALKKRGGRLVVIDPRRTKTAALADTYHPIRPGTDAYLFLAILHTLFAEKRVALGRLVPWVQGMETVRALVQAYSPERVAAHCGIDAADIRRLARDLATAERAVIHGRIGTCTQRFGSLASWLVEVIHVLTGNLDRTGGALFPKAAAGATNTRGTPGQGRGFLTGRRASRVRGRPEVMSEFPCACLAEEIDTPGDGQVRALLTVAGNPVLSTPNGGRLERALDDLDFMVSVDIYRNETTRHADVILPDPSPLACSHYDLVFNQLACRNVARYSPAVLPLEAEQLHGWQIRLRLLGIASGLGPDADLDALDDRALGSLIGKSVADPSSPIHGRETAEIFTALAPRRGPERMLDFMLRVGPYGDGFGADPDGLNLATLEDTPHGLDLGPLAPRLPEVLRTPSGKIELAPQSLLDDLPRLEADLDAPHDLMLIGRRDLQSNNSWMHNIPKLVAGKPRCTLHIHPQDAARCGLRDGGTAQVRSRVGSLEVPVEVEPGIMPGVVSIPHGWGHDDPETALHVAQAHAGVNSNLLTDEAVLDEPSGNAVLCGIPVTVAPSRNP